VIVKRITPGVLSTDLARMDDERSSCGLAVCFRCYPARRTSVVGAADRFCYIGSSSKISTANFPSLLDRNGRPSVNAFAAARSSASTIV
jgi:hypothetical protein